MPAFFSFLFKIRSLVFIISEISLKGWWPNEAIKSWREEGQSRRHPRELIVLKLNSVFVDCQVQLGMLAFTSVHFHKSRIVICQMGGMPSWKICVYDPWNDSGVNSVDGWISRMKRSWWSQSHIHQLSWDGFLGMIVHEITSKLWTESGASLPVSTVCCFFGSSFAAAWVFCPRSTPLVPLQQNSAYRGYGHKRRTVACFPRASSLFHNRCP